MKNNCILKRREITADFFGQKSRIRLKKKQSPLQENLSETSSSGGYLDSVMHPKYIVK